jgi:hypothetical protein
LFKHHTAFAVLCTELVIAGPLLVLYARHQWFRQDEWDFVANRSLSHPDGLLHAHGVAWSTLPILVYRVLYAAVGIKSYWPYLVAVVAAHLGVVLLLWLVMRRHGVSAWVATALATVLLVFGPGWEAILWGFELTVLGALLFGLAQLLAVDRDGPIDRLDALGLAFGLAALMCSEVGITMVVIAAVTALVRRGWKPAALQAGVLGAVYVAWYGYAHPSLPLDPNHEGTASAVGSVFSWAARSVADTFRATGRGPVIGLLLVGLLVVGLVLAWSAMPLRRFRRKGAAVAALLVGGVLGIGMLAALERTTQAPDAGRYLYVNAVMLIPAFGVAVTALVARWKFVAPVLAVLLVVLVPLDAREFRHVKPVAAASSQLKPVLWELAHSSVLTHVPENQYVDQADFTRAVTAGWLRKVAKSVPPPPLSVRAGHASAQAVAQLAIDQGHGPLPARCVLVHQSKVERLKPGEVFGIAPAPGLPLEAIYVRPLLRGSGLVAPVRFDLSYGQRFRVVLPFKAGLGSGPGAPPFELCK